MVDVNKLALSYYKTAREPCLDTIAKMELKKNGFKDIRLLSHCTTVFSMMTNATAYSLQSCLDISSAENVVRFSEPTNEIVKEKNWY